MEKRWNIRLGNFSGKQAEGLVTIAIETILNIACELYLFDLRRNHEIPGLEVLKI